MLKSDQPDSALARVKAETLIESLPWLKRFQGKIIVVKFGGNAMVDDALQKSFAEDMAYLRWIGLRPVVVHGGGPQITARLAELGLPSEFKGGLRVTTKETIEVVRDVLRTNISARLAGLIEFAGAKTTVLSGEDRNLFMAEKVLVEVDGEQVDIGLVGEVVSVDPTVVLEALDAGRVPVISTVAPSTTDGLLNINADQAASSLAIALGAEKLVVLTDVPGLYADWPNRESLLSEVTIDDLRELLPRLQSGMIPKMKACLQAVEQGVPSAHIIDGRTPHSILLEIFTKSGYGTMVNP
jgi:acetylglutamate kinase